MRKAGEVVTIEKILNVLDDSARESTPQSIQVHMHSLLKKLSTQIIKTVRGVGYRLE